MTEFFRAIEKTIANILAIILVVFVFGFGLGMISTYFYISKEFSKENLNLTECLYLADIEKLRN